MIGFVKGIKALLNRLTTKTIVVEHKLSKQDRALIDDLALQTGAVFDEVQNLTLEANASRKAVQALAEEIERERKERWDEFFKAEGREDRPLDWEDYPGKGEGTL